MQKFINKFMTMVGGKRGLSVIGSSIVTILLSKGIISPSTAETIGAVAGALGLVGIGHSLGKAGVGVPDAAPVP